MDSYLSDEKIKFMRKLKFITLFLLTIVPLSGIKSQNDSAYVFNGKKWVIPGPEYEAGWLHRFFFGSHWRDVWTTPLDVDVIDLDKFAGGLTPVKLGGGLQTKSLTLKGEDGKEYKFRSVDKDPKKTLPPDLQESIASDLVKDQISSAHPLAPLVIAPLLTAVGVLQSVPVLAVMPDDEKLGKFRKEFGGMLGTMQELPKDLGIEGSDKVISSDKLFKRLDDNHDEFVDSREFLKARLMDIFIGDWDRHRGQWKWARYEEDGVKIYKPIPEDRDQAFTKFDGLLPSMIFTSLIPQINDFGEDYPSMKKLTWNGRFLDQRFLVFLDKQTWDSVTDYVYSKLTDNVIDDAVKQLPPEVYKISGEELVEKLKSRRNQLKEASNEFYDRVNKYADIIATDKRDYAEIKGLPNAQTEISLYKRNKESGEKEGNALYHKIFDNNLTHEFRIYLKDGDDKAVVSGKDDNTPRIRIIGGEGKDELVDNSDLPVKFYDDGKKTIIKEGENTDIDDHKYIEPWDSLQAVYDKMKDKLTKDEKGNAEEKINDIKYDIRRVDKGHQWTLAPLFGYTSDYGVLFGFSRILYKYGYHVDPYVYKMQLTLGYTPKIGGFQGLLVDYLANFFGIIRGTQINLHARKSGIEVINYFGPGNETSYNDTLYSNKYYRVGHEEYTFNPSIEFPTKSVFRFNVGILAKYFHVNLDSNSYLMSTPTYGTGKISYLAGQSGFIVDGRDNAAAPLSGYFVSVQGSYYPKVFNNQNSFSKGSGDVRAYLHANPFTLALRVRGEKIWGTYPFYESAFIGGTRSLRGFFSERFAGDASLVGGAELRTKLFDMSLLLPETIYMFLFAESGKVFLKGEDSKLWHTGYGGGLAISIVNRDATFSLSFARSKERKVAIYFNTGFVF